MVLCATKRPPGRLRGVCLSTEVQVLTLSVVRVLQLKYDLSQSCVRCGFQAFRRIFPWLIGRLLKAVVVGSELETYLRCCSLWAAWQRRCSRPLSRPAKPNHATIWASVEESLNCLFAFSFKLTTACTFALRLLYRDTSIGTPTELLVSGCCTQPTAFCPNPVVMPA